MSLRIISSGLYLLIWVLPRATIGCPYSVRDVGFVELNSIPYRFYFFVKDDTPQKDGLKSTFERASDAALMDSNVKAEIVNIDQQKTHPALEYLRFWELETFPSAILVSPRGHSTPISDFGFRISDSSVPQSAIGNPRRAFPIRQSAIRNAQSVSVSLALESVVSSPGRDRVMDKIVKAWCVVLLVEGKNSLDNAKANKAVKGAIRDIAQTMNRAGRTVEEAPHLITLGRDSFAQEEILLWSLGLEDYAGRGPRVALLFGRGRQFGPVLEDQTLTRDTLFQVLSMVGMKCGCDSDLDYLSGAIIPRRWGQKLRAEVMTYLGFDPDNPLVKMQVSSALASSGVPGEAQGGVISDLSASTSELGFPQSAIAHPQSDAAFGYSEGEMVNWEEYRQLAEAPVQTTPEGVAAGVTISDSAMQGSAICNPQSAICNPQWGDATTLDKRIGRVVLLVVLGMVLLVLGGGALVVARASRP